MADTLLIADEDKTFRADLREALEGVAHVVGEAETADSAISLARQLQPDVLLIDIDLREEGGIPTARWIRQQQPGIRVILMTAHGEEAYLESTGRAGVDAFLRKRDAKASARSVLKRVADPRRSFRAAPEGGRIRTSRCS